MNEFISFMDPWLSIDNIQNKVRKELETVLQNEYDLSIKEFYVLYYLSIAPDKRLRLQQLQEKIGLSQSALSRLVAGMEASSCGALEKHICKDDRRGTYTQMTDLGENKLRKSLEVFQCILKKHLEPNNFEGIVKELIDVL